MVHALELNIEFDNVILVENEKYLLTFSIENTLNRDIKVIPSFELMVGERKVLIGVFEETEINKGQKSFFSAEFRTPSIYGEGEIIVNIEYLDGQQLTKSYPIYVVKEQEPLHIAFVWHHHQAPQFYPDGKYKDDWPFRHVHTGSFYGFKYGGPYYVHLQIHRREGEFRDIDHLSPSLLDQWKNALENGYTFQDDVVRDDERIKKIREVLEGYRRLAKKGVIEVLGSVYAHTVQGLVIKIFSKEGMGDFIRKLLEWELKLGIKKVYEILGVKPRGVWTPEMFWTMDLLDIYDKCNIEYTVLCEQHFRKAGGDKDSIYEPYILEDPMTGNRLTIFFRDIKLSDWISFRADFKSIEHADLEARRFVVSLARRYTKYPGGICVIALDGENWMIMPSVRIYAPFFLEKVIHYISKSRVLKLVTLSEYLRYRKPQKILWYVPWGSWINLSGKQWTGGVKDELWRYVLDKLSWVAALYKLIDEEILEDVL